MKGKKVLIIEDDLHIRDIVNFSFKSVGAQVFQAENGQVGLKMLYEHRPDLVILDVMMPVQDGWETCRQIRMLDDVPIIILTSLRGEADIIRGLDYGADDFLTKPFIKDVLLARARAVLRRANYFPEDGASGSYLDDYLDIDLEKRLIRVNGEAIRLTPTEFKLLSYLVNHKGIILTSKQILENVWGWDYQDSPEYVHVYVSNLRRKIDVDPKKPEYFLTEHGVGYKFASK